MSVCMSFVCFICITVWFISLYSFMPISVFLLSYDFLIELTNNNLVSYLQHESCFENMLCSLPCHYDRKK